MIDKKLAAAFAILCVCGLVLLGAETGFRLYEKKTLNIPFLESAARWYDPVLGWKGKKEFGNAASKKFKVFIIGDSFTHGCGIPEKDLYYAAIKQKPDVELFVYGGGGYGTLQEYLVLDKYFDEIKPDLVILQVCANDFINDLWELESRSYDNNNLLVRPFWVNGKIELKYPRFWGLPAVILYRSRMLYRGNETLERFLSRHVRHTVERDIEAHGTDDEDFKKSVTVMDTLVEKMKTRVGATPMVAFGVDDVPVYMEQFRAIFKRNDIEFIEDVPAQIRELESQGVNVRLEDKAHWNALGHSVCGEVLARELDKKGYFSRKELP